MIRLYTSLMNASGFFLRSLLKKRLRQGKEDPARLDERMGVAAMQRPEGKLIWFHAASVGEAQSTLILIRKISEDHPGAHILVTTGTVTSAQLMEKRLPKNAFHQYIPLDHPKWVQSFLDHWSPDAVIWMESEIWPNMLKYIKARNIPAVLINARLSEKSFKRWKLAGNQISSLLETFNVILTQTDDDAGYYMALGGLNVHVSGNLKYAAEPLPFDADDYSALKKAIGDRPFWLYASTHDGEEALACRLHMHLKRAFPNILTIIVPRHPERRDAIVKNCERYELSNVLRGNEKKTPQSETDIYIADTMGELGLFYKFAPIACIGRSFSSDGGGGHNPIEAAQYSCAILHGPNVQNLSDIYKEFDSAGACLRLKDEADFQTRLEKLLKDEGGMEALQNKSQQFVSKKSDVLPIIMKHLNPILDNLNASQTTKKCA